VCTPPCSFVSNIPNILHAADRTRLGKSSTQPYSVQLNFACVETKKLATRTNTILDCEISAFPSPLDLLNFLQESIRRSSVTNVSDNLGLAQATNLFYPIAIPQSVASHIRHTVLAAHHFLKSLRVAHDTSRSEPRHLPLCCIVLTCSFYLH